MALTDAQKAAVRRFLGHSGRYLQTSESRLDQALSAISNSAADEDLIGDLLVLCQGVMTEITSTVRTVAKAGALGSIRLDGARTLAILRSEGRMYAAQISNVLGVPIFNGGAFSTGGYRDFASEDSDGGTSGNEISYG